MPDINQQHFGADTAAVVDTAFDDDLPTRGDMLLDMANLCTFFGAALALMAMAAMWKGRHVLVEFLFVYFATHSTKQK